jgi:ribonuclease VapC
VEEYIESTCISTVYLSEVAGRFTRDGIDATLLLQQIQQTSIEIIPFFQLHALHAASLLPHTRRYGLSLGDRACLGLAKDRQLPVLTTDTVWTELMGIEVEIVQIR